MIIIKCDICGYEIQEHERVFDFTMGERSYKEYMESIKNTSTVEIRRVIPHEVICYVCNKAIADAISTRAKKK